MPACLALPQRSPPSCSAPTCSIHPPTETERGSWSELQSNEEEEEEEQEEEGIVTGWVVRLAAG